MAVIHMDDFGGYGTDVDLMLAGIYAGFIDPGTSLDVTPGLVTDPDGVSSGRVLQLGPVGQNPDLNVRFVLPAGAVSTLGVMLRVWFPSLPSAGKNGITLLDISSNKLFTLRVTSAGYLEIRSGDYSGTVLYTSSIPAITAQGWWHIEWKTVISATAGSFEVRVEGIPVAGLVQSNINTGTTSIGQIGLCQRGDTGGASHTYYVKDYVIWDATGAYANDFVGTCIVHPHTLTADEALNWSLVGGATGISILNNDPPTPSEYMFAVDDPLPSPYQGIVSALPEDVTSVRAVQVRYMAAKNDGGDATVQAGIISDVQGTPSTGTGAARPITIAQTFWWDIFHTDPETSAPWTPSAFNNDNVAVQLNRTV